MSERILVVEDEANIASFVSAYLEKAGYVVDRAVNGAEAKEKAVSAEPVADPARPQPARHGRPRGLPRASARLAGADPDADGARRRRRQDRRPRGRGRRLPDEAVQPARAGRAHPLDPAPRHGAAAGLEGRARTHGAISIDAGRREVLVDGAPIQLAPKEFDLFWELLDHSGLVLTRDQLLERVWGYTFAGDTRTVDVHVRQLRRKIGDTCPS